MFRCTQYLVGNPFAEITAWLRRGMEAISLWHCWGVMEAQDASIAALSSSTVLGLVSLNFLFTIPHRFLMGFRSGELAGQLSTVMPWSVNHLPVVLALWAGARSWNLHLHKALQQLEAWSAPNTGLQAFWHFLLPSLPPDSGTLISEWHAEFAFIRKKHFGPLSNSPVLLLCSPGQALLPLFLVQKCLDLGNAAPVAHFLHTPVHSSCGCLYSRLSPLLPQVPQGLETVLLHNLSQGPVTSSGCATFSATLFPSHRLPTEMPWDSILGTAYSLRNVFLCLTLLLEGVNNGLLDSSQVGSLTHYCGFEWRTRLGVFKSLRNL